MLQVNPGKEPAKKKKKVSEGILPNVYCPVQQPIPVTDFTTALTQHLSRINSDAQILQTLAAPYPPTIDSQFGPVPIGSPLSYQLKPHINTGDIITHPDVQFPHFPLPNIESHYSTVLTKAEQELYNGLHTDRALALEIEEQTKEQSKDKKWHEVRRQRLTSSVFKEICSCQSNFERLAKRLAKTKNIQTAAMKYGIEQEPIAAKHYTEVTGNSAWLCGFVINPSCHHLGTSPDRKIYDANAFPNYGLLEIKCPMLDSFEDSKCLTKNVNGTYRLKHTHSYYFQIMGQLGLTGMEWCDFFVYCKQNYHRERIYFDAEKWMAMKLKLDKFYFEFFLQEFLK